MNGAVILFIAMFILIFMGVPVAFSIAASSSVFLLITQMKPLLIVPQRMLTGLDSFPYLAIPLFILVGNLMDTGGISRRLVNWANLLAGGLPGGLGVVAVLACTIFAALTGSAPATVAAIGSIMIAPMVEHGYDKKTAVGLCAAAGALGPIIPPSITMIVFGVTMSVSIPAMFLGGIVPGLLIALLLIAANMFHAFRHPEILKHRRTEKMQWGVFFRTTLTTLPTLLLPVIILGGIYNGRFTPTESAAVGVAYALLLGFCYRELRIKDIPKLLVRSAETSAMVCFIISVANILSWIMASTQASNAIVNSLMTFVNNKFSFLLVMNLFLILVGALLDQGAAVIIICPMLFNLGTSLGIEPLHLALIMCVNLVLGNVTPPFGYNLFTAASVSELKFNDVVKGVMPYLLIEVAVLFFLAYCEPACTWLPRMAGY